MKLVALELEYFRQHRHTSLQFDVGVTGIVGPNGAGKTSLCEAIAFALYGSRALRGKVDDVRTRGVGREAKVKVTLTLEHDGQTLRVERTLNDASLYQGGDATTVAIGTREVTQALTVLLGMSYEEFAATYFTEQKGLEFLSGQKGATEREKFVLRMLGFHRFERVQEVLREDKRDLKNEVSGAEGSLGTRAELEERLKVEEADNIVLTERLEEATVSLTQTEQQTNTLQARFARIEGVRTKVQAAQQEIRELQARYEEQTKTLKRSEQERRTLLDRLAQAADPEKVKAELQLIETKLSTADSLRNDLTKELRQQEQQWRKEQTEISTQRRVSEKNKETLAAKLKEIHQLRSKGSCPTCGQPLGQSVEEVEAHLQAELETTERSYGELLAKEQSLSQAPEAISKLQTRLTELENSITANKSAREEWQRLEREREAIVKVEKVLSDLRAELEKLDQRLSVARAAVLEFKFSDEEYLREKGALDAAQRLLNVARLQRVKLEGEANTKQVLIVRTKQDITNFDIRAEQLGQLRKRLNVLEQADEVLTEFRRYVNASIRPRLAELASEFIAELTDGRYTSIEVGADFTPTVLDDGEPKPVISGGEQDILNLCMRLALSQFLAERAGQSISLLVLDEVFGSLDENRRSNVLELLERLGGRFEQILVITHLEDIREGVRHLLYVDYEDSSGAVSVAPIDMLQDGVVNL